MVEVGEKAPDFTAQGAKDGEIHTYSLDELIDGQALVLAVYPYDFNPVCTDQLCGIRDAEWLTFGDDVNIVGLSGDGPYSHVEFAEEIDISYPLLSDTDRSICAAYGVLNDEYDGVKSVPQRSMFLILPDQHIEYKWIADDNRHEWDITPVREIYDRITALDT